MTLIRTPVVLANRKMLVNSAGKPLIAQGIAPDPVSNYTYLFPFDLSAVDPGDWIVVPVNKNGTTTVTDPNNWNKVILIDFGDEPLGKFSLFARGTNGAGIKCRAIIGIGATLNLTGMNTTPYPNGNPAVGNDIISACFKSGAPNPPVIWFSRIDYAPVNMTWGDFIKVGNKITGTAPAWNTVEYVEVFWQKFILRNGHWTWTGPNNNKTAHSDLFQSSLGGYNKLFAADGIVRWNGNGWYFLVGGNIQNAPSGKTFANNNSIVAFNRINMSPAIPPVGSGLGVNPAQYFLQSGTLDGFGGWNYPVSTIGNSTALIEGRYNSVHMHDVWCELGPTKPDKLTYFGFPNIPKANDGNGVAFTNFIAAAGKRPDGLGRVEGDRRVSFIANGGAFPIVPVQDFEIGFTRACRTRAAVLADLGF